MPSNKVTEVIEWLDAHAGGRLRGWQWRRGDIRGNGVYIVDRETALLFTLRFDFIIETSIVPLSLSKIFHRAQCPPA